MDIEFTAHNIRLDDGTLTKPDVGYSMETYPWFVSARRILETVFPEDKHHLPLVDIGCLEGGYAVEFARIGRDEFVILAMNSFETSAEKLISRFEQVLNDHPLQTKRPYTLSLSLGITCFNPQNPCSIEVLLAEADKIMYENKQKKSRQGGLKLALPLFVHISNSN